MNFSIPNFKNWSKEHTGIFIVGIIFVCVFAAAFVVYLTKKPNISALQDVLAQGNYDSAISSGEAELQKNKGDINVVHFLVGAYLSKAVATNDPVSKNKAIALINSELKLHPNDAELLLLRGSYYYYSNAFDLAIQSYQQSASISPNNPAVWSALGQVYEKQKNYTKADSSYNRALGLDPNDQIGNLGRIRSFFRKNDSKVARALAIAFLPKAKDVLTKAAVNEMLGLDSLAQGDTQNAQKYLLQAISLNGNLPISLATYAYTLLSDATKASPKARVDILAHADRLASQAIAVSPNYAYAYAVLSRIKGLEGDDTAKEKMAAKALAVLPLDTITKESDKQILKSTLSTSTPAISKFKVISIKRITTPPAGATASSSGIMIIKSK